MDLILFAIDFILHVDVHLKELFEHYGIWVYAILFLIIFCETGLVVTPSCPAIPCCLPQAPSPWAACWMCIPWRGC